jgi:hypothetical protein
MPCGWQMLSLTADNASANDTMTRQLAKLIPSFGGEPTRTRCFLHIVNLVAKSILKEFDSSKNKANLDEDLLATAGDDLAEGLEGEEQITLAERGLTAETRNQPYPISSLRVQPDVEST